MSFTTEQAAALSAKLDASHVKMREQAGQKLSYIEGWHAIAEANRIFGFDAWDRETVHTACVWQGERTTRHGKVLQTASYVARVRVTVRAGDRVVVREGTGAGSGMGSDAGEAHESAIKEAETDAMKRALMTFGNPFGLALYDKSQENVESPAERQAAERQRLAVEAFRLAIGECASLEMLDAWWKDHKAEINKLGDLARQAVINAASDRKRALVAASQAAE